MIPMNIKTLQTTTAVMERDPSINQFIFLGKTETYNFSNVKYLEPSSLNLSSSWNDSDIFLL